MLVDDGPRAVVGVLETNYLCVALVCGLNNSAALTDAPADVVVIRAAEAAGDAGEAR